MNLLRRALMGGAMAWAVALPAATWIAAQAHPGAVAYLFALGVYFVGSAVCHQLDARSFHLWAGHQMPVCARCAGIYVAAAVAAVVAAVRPVRSSRVNPRVAVGLALLPAAASLVYEWTTGITPSNLARAATGAVLGGTVGWLLFVEGTRPAEQTTL